MIKEVKILLFPEEHKSKNGAFFEDLIRSVFEKQGYDIERNINFTGLEIDILGKHKNRNEKLVIECKAKNKPKSTEIKNFAFNVIDKEANYGYFLYTSELDHQAAGLVNEWKTKGKYNNLTFLGPNEIIDLLVDANKIKTLDLSIIPNKENIDKIILAYTYFGIFYIIIPYNGTKKDFFYLVDAVTSIPIEDIREIANSKYSQTLTIENALKAEIKDIKDLQFLNINTEKKEIIPIREKFTCDYPIEYGEWVGRKQELKSISSKNFKVIFITGIGGQGKSALASYFIQEIVENDDYWEYWDWRDLKEEDNRLHTKIISIIERLTNGEIRSNHIKDETLDDLLDLLFRYLHKRKIVFVFDNIDKYIDYEEFKPTAGINKLLSLIKTRPHSSKFIFTCRPFVMLADAHLYHIKLEGLKEEDTIELFKKSQLNFKSENIISIAKEIHKLTEGHAQWIKLLIGQAHSGEDALNKFITAVKDKTNFKEDNLSAIFSQNILNTIWDNLNDNQKTLLRSLSETVKAETEENLGKIINPEINYNRFHKALRKLKRLNLIVIKTLKNQEDQIELHPLVKEFMLQKYPLSNERSKYIMLFVNFYDNAICVLRERLNWKMPFQDFEQWTSKIELEVNKLDYKSALVTLQEVSIPLLTAGYLTEFIRVSELIFSNINWKEAINEEYSYFHSLFKNYITTLTELGKNVEANDYLVKYSNSIQGKGNNYLNYCDIYCYYYWFIGDYDNAIKWGERILNLKKDEGNNAIINTLALAWRDTKKEDNINKALNYFLEGEKLENILKEKIKTENGGPFYGNIGRCLHFKKDFNNAIICYKRSIFLLEKEKVSNTEINKGYAYLWISEVYNDLNKIELSIYFMKLAIIIWNKVAPPKANKVTDLLLKVLDENKSFKYINQLSDNEIIDYCNNVLTNN